MLVSSHTDMVYLLQEGPFVKIGWSGQSPWDKRLHQIRNATPYDVVVLAARVGTLEQEQELHRNTRAQNSTWHHRGDWYHDSHELRVYLDRFFFPVEGDPIGSMESGRTDGPPSLSVSEQL